MYTVTNFPTKKALKEAVQAYKKEPNAQPVRLFSPGIGAPKENGIEFVEGPHYPQPHSWYAQVFVKNGIVISVK